MVFNGRLSNPESIRERMNSAYRGDENQRVDDLLKIPLLPPGELQQRTQNTARKIATKARAAYQNQGVVEKLLHQYDLSHPGRHCLDEPRQALLRHPGSTSRDLLISDKISTIQWLSQGQSQIPC